MVNKMMNEMKEQLMKYYRKLGKERAFYVTCFAGFLVILLCITLNAMEIMPELRLPRGREAGELSNSAVWLGMKVAPISRDIRTEFKLPAKVKGMFVADAGLGEALKRGVTTGDVICTINGKKFKDIKSFVEVASATRYYDGILLDVFRNGKNVYISIPFLYDYGPVWGPNQGRWQLGSPLIKQLLPYGRARTLPNINWTTKEQQ